MSAAYFEVRVCLSCHLRYPLTEGHPFGQRCPRCLGETRVALRKEMDGEGSEKEEVKGREIKRKKVKAVLMDNVRSAWNVGSILRSAEGFGFNHAYLCGITPTPEMDAVRKTALGAEEYVTWSYHHDAMKLVQGLKKEGWTILALEEDEGSIVLSKGKRLTADRNLLIVGNEVTGVDPDLLDLADHIFHIPMYGRKRSFNVANAFSIAAYVLSG